MRTALALIGSFTLIACANVAKDQRSTLVGEWRYADQMQSCHYVFKDNGTFSGEVMYHGAKISQFKGKWAVRGDQLFYDYTSDVLGNIPPGSKDSDKLLSVHQNYFVIEARDGSKRRYERVK